MSEVDSTDSMGVSTWVSYTLSDVSDVCFLAGVIAFSASIDVLELVSVSLILMC